jgi:hypothetical protein
MIAANYWLPHWATNVNLAALARHFRKGYFQAFRRWPSRTYMAPIARQLNGRVGFFRALGKHATWYVPAVIGAYNIIDASPEMRMHTLFAEGFGIVGGALLAKAGGALGTWAAISVLGLGPFGLFISVFICASFFGILGNEISKNIGGAVYDFGSQLKYGQSYNSPEQLLEGIQWHR